MSHGTPTIIRHYAKSKKPHLNWWLVGIVTTVSTPFAFSAHFHTYKVYPSGHTNLCQSFGQWAEEKGAVDAFSDWVASAQDGGE